MMNTLYEINNTIQLFRKIFAVMKAIPELAKTGSMSENGSESYKYHEADSIRVRFRKELLKQKLLCLPTSVDELTWRNATSTGGSFNYSSQRITFTFIDSETGEKFDCQAVGWGGDALDKAAPKAAIQALKYFLVNGFFVEGIELDGDSAQEQIAGREANKTHQWFEGHVDAWHIDGNVCWLLLDGVRLFAKDKKIIKQLGKLSDLSEVNISDRKQYRIRTYMGHIWPDSKNPHPLIDKIDPLKLEEVQEVAK